MSSNETKNVILLKHQYEFITDWHSKFLALVSGYGAGKTFSLCRKAIVMAEKNIGFKGILFEPTTPLLHDILIPDFEQALHDLKIPYTLKKTPNYNYTLHFPEGDSIIMLRAFENWERLVGVNAAWIGVDEVDTVKKDIAEKAVNKLIGRIRVGNVNQFFFTTTPEGFVFMYDFFVKRHNTNKRQIKAKTTDNPYLPQSYIDNLYENYPPQLVDAYVNGEYVNLVSGSIYKHFDRFRNGTDVEDDGKCELHIGIDFNVTKMSAVVHRVIDGLPYAIEEIVDVFDTPEMVQEIKKRYKNRVVNIYPDASGDNRKTVNANETDIKLLKKEGWKIRVNKKNPSVRNRINSVNTLILNANNEVKYFVNEKKCPNYVEALEQIVYDKNGNPDKQSGLDHVVDAGGYFIAYKYPIIKPKAEEKNIKHSRYHQEEDRSNDWMTA